MFPDSWTYANAQPIHRKGNRQLKSNYRPISLLPICGKILEKIIFDQVYSFLNGNKLISKNRSSFKTGDSTIQGVPKRTHPRKEAQFERVKINFNARTCIVWQKYHGISHLERIYTHLYSVGHYLAKNRGVSIPGGDFQRFNEFKELKLTI